MLGDTSGHRAPESQGISLKDPSFSHERLSRPNLPQTFDFGDYEVDPLCSTTIPSKQQYRMATVIPTSDFESKSGTDLYCSYCARSSTQMKRTKGQTMGREDTPLPRRFATSEIPLAAANRLWHQRAFWPDATESIQARDESPTLHLLPKRRSRASVLPEREDAMLATRMKDLNLSPEQELVSLHDTLHMHRGRHLAHTSHAALSPSMTGSGMSSPVRRSLTNVSPLMPQSPRPSNLSRMEANLLTSSSSSSTYSTPVSSTQSSSLHSSLPTPSSHGSSLLGFVQTPASSRTVSTPGTASPQRDSAFASADVWRLTAEQDTMPRTILQKKALLLRKNEPRLDVTENNQCTSLLDAPGRQQSSFSTNTRVSSNTSASADSPLLVGERYLFCYFTMMSSFVTVNRASLQESFINAENANAVTVVDDFIGPFHCFLVEFDDVRDAISAYKRISRGDHPLFAAFTPSSSSTERKADALLIRVDALLLLSPHNAQYVLQYLFRKNGTSQPVHRLPLLSATNTVHLSGLHPNLTLRRVTKLMKRYGDMCHMELAPSGAWMVTFFSASAALEAKATLHGSFSQDMVVTVEFVENVPLRKAHDAIWFIDRYIHNVETTTRLLSPDDFGKKTLQVEGQATMSERRTGREPNAPKAKTTLQKPKSSKNQLAESPAHGPSEGNTINIDRILSGEDKRTTVMLRNVPNKYSQEMMLACIDQTHQGLYDFFYLRIDFATKSNFGYCFINFIDPKDIVSFAQRLSGRRWVSVA